MSKRVSLYLSLTVAALGLAAPLAAQGRSAVSTAELDAAVSARPAANGDAVRTLLASPQAQRIAARMGIKPVELSARVAGLDQASLSLLAERARVSQRDLAGGSNTIVISTTAVIIGLLILILLAS